MRIGPGIFVGRFGMKKMSVFHEGTTSAPGRGGSLAELAAQAVMCRFTVKLQGLQ